MKLSARGKVLLHIFAVALMFFGFVGFAIYAPAIGRFEVYHKQLPLHYTNGVAVDSTGRLYFGTDQHHAIQVYDNFGSFLYGFSFPTSGGSFSFYIDAYDYIHVATTRGNNTYVFYKGNLISQDQQYGAYTKYSTINKRTGKYIDKDGFIYQPLNHYKIKIWDSKTNQEIRTVTPNSPIWPFSVLTYWGFAATGLCSIFWMNRKELAKLKH